MSSFCFACEFCIVSRQGEAQLCVVSGAHYIFCFLSLRITNLKDGAMLFLGEAELIYLTSVALHRHWRPLCVQSCGELSAGLQA